MLELPILKSENVHMKDEAAVSQKINKIIQGGADKLQLVTDFDLTLTKQHINGIHSPSSACIFFKSKQLPKKCKEKDDMLRLKYRAIEIDPKISKEEKINDIIEWYLETHKNLQGHPFDSKEIDEIANAHSHLLRDRTQELFTKLKTLNIPVIVFSAGLGDIVEAILKHQNILYENVNIISNFLNFKDNILDGFKNSDQLIHTYNKNEHAVEHKYFKILHDRTNVILMGDTIGDATMADGLKNTDTVLRIGFLYDKVEESLPSYKDAFDIVLVDDQTMNVVLEIFNLIS